MVGYIWIVFYLCFNHLFLFIFLFFYYFLYIVLFYGGDLMYVLIDKFNNIYSMCHTLNEAVSRLVDMIDIKYMTVAEIRTLGLTIIFSPVED